jgi:hypothetical protein
MVRYGSKAYARNQMVMSALPSKADIHCGRFAVRFGPKPDVTTRLRVVSFCFWDYMRRLLSGA